MMQQTFKMPNNDKQRKKDAKGSREERTEKIVTNTNDTKPKNQQHKKIENKKAEKKN